MTRGVTLSIQVEGNNYEGQGLFGEVMAVSPPHGETSGAGRANSHTAIGNVLLYGLTSGELFAVDWAGERLAVSNSGAGAVVEGMVDYCYGYMTNVVVVSAWPRGVQFSSGVACVYDRSKLFQNRCNMDNVDIGSGWRSDDI